MHEAMLAQRARDIDSTRRLLNDASLCLPRWIWLLTALTGTSARIHAFLLARLQQRRLRLLREAHTLIELLRLDKSSQIDPK